MNVRRTVHGLAPYLGSASLEFFDAGLQRCRGSLVFVEEVVRSICRRERETKQETDDPAPKIKQCQYTQGPAMRNPNPPRNPPMGFFGLESGPRLGDGVASLRRMGEVESSLAAVLRWTRFRASEAIVVVVVVCLGISRHNQL